MRNVKVQRRLLGAYIQGLEEVVEYKVEFQAPSTMEQAVKLAITTENVEKHNEMV